MESGGLTPKLKPKVNEMNEHDSGTFKTRSKCNSTRSVKELISGFENIFIFIWKRDVYWNLLGARRLTKVQGRKQSLTQ